MNSLGNTEINVLGASVNIFVEGSAGLARLPYPDESVPPRPLTLNQIYQHYGHLEGTLYVVEDGGLHGTIYRCGNYGEGVWQKYAETKGYA